MISSCVDPSCVNPSCVDPSCVDYSCFEHSCVVRSCVDLVENVFGFSDANLEADANALFKHNAKTTLKAEVYTIHAYSRSYNNNVSYLDINRQKTKVHKCGCCDCCCSPCAC
jgi:hypothetical protein